MERKSKVQRYVKSPALWTILFILTGGYFLATWVNSIGGPEAVGEEFGVLAPVITGASLFILTPTPFPTDLIAIAHGALYGFVPAALLNWVVLWLAVFLEASIGRRLGVDFDIEEEMKKMPKVLQRFPIGHPIFLILGRQIPMVGSNVTTLLPGALGVPMARIAWCSAIGIIPGATALAAAGAGFLQL